MVQDSVHPQYVYGARRTKQPPRAGERGSGRALTSVFHLDENKCLSPLALEIVEVAT